MVWATREDVDRLTGVEATLRDVNHAQAIIETASGLVEANVPATDVRWPWMHRAVAYQAAFIALNPDLFGALDVASEHVESHVYRTRDTDPFAATLAPAAKVALARAGIDVTTIVGEAFDVAPAWSFPEPYGDVPDLKRELL